MKQNNFHVPPKDCNLCERLEQFRLENCSKYPDFANAPVPSFGGTDAWLLIVGLAPGLKGANRTGRPFTGDYAGDLLYKALLKYGLANGTYKASPDDGLVLKGCRITNAVRCVPPQNKVTGVEVSACGAFLVNEMQNMPNLKAILALGTVAHGAVLSAFGIKKSAVKFGHGAIHQLSEHQPDNHLLFADSYHCSRYNTSTKRLTEQMFFEVFEKLLERV